MIRFDCDILNNGRTRRYRILRDNEQLTVARVHEQLVSDHGLRTGLIDLLTACPYAAARFETPAVTTQTRDSPFEFVLVDSPGLIRRPDPSSFNAQLNSSDPKQSVIAFPNLSGDATMIVPRPLGRDPQYTHLLEFLRNAPADQAHTLWATTAAALLNQIGDTPLWLSTAGGGVPWLHVRIDLRPKYYNYHPYTAILG